MDSPSSLRERLVWSDDGSLRDNDIRYLLIRADSLMQLFKQLEPEPRIKALQAFSVSLREHGRKSLESRMRRANLTPQELYNDLARSSGSQLGWGIWTFSPAKADGFNVEVANSPFVSGFGASDHPVCFPIAGMLSAMGQLVLSSPVNVDEIECAAVSGGCCRFKITATQASTSR